MSRSKIEHGLYISDVQHVLKDDVDDMYDEIVTVCRKDLPVENTQFALVDRNAEQQDVFDAAVDHVRGEIQGYGRERDTLVHCIAGQSRSPAVVATAIAARDDVLFDDARDRVWKQRTSIGIHPSLRAHGMRYLGEKSYEDRA